MIGQRREMRDKRLDPMAWLRDKIARLGLEWFAKRYYGIYPGSVIDVADPQGRGRIRLTCPAIGLVEAKQVSPEYWAMPCMPGLGTDPETKQMTGQFHPPDVGTNVWVQFQFGDPRYPVYVGGFLTVDTVSDTFTAEDALRKGIRTRTGHYIRMSDDPADLHLVIGKGDGAGAPSPMFLAMTKEGSCMLSNAKGSTLYMNAERPETSILTANDQGEVVSMLMLGDDKITLATKSGGAITIDGKNINSTGDNVVATAAKQFYANAGGVRLGKNAKEPAVRGYKLVQWALLHQHVITTPTPGSATGPGPLPPPALYKELSEVVTIA